MNNQRIMLKYFNVAGPCNVNDHYMVPVSSRNNNIMSLIDQGHYFVIHAARQSGKTTVIQSLVNTINEEGKYYALYCSLETANVFTKPEDGIPQIFYNLQSEFSYSKLPNNKKFGNEINIKEISTVIKNAFRDYCAELDKPLIVFFDEIDGLEDGTLIAFLRQLRDGFITRNQIPFLQSVALVGMRNIRDFKSKIREGKETLGSVSPFNIITESLTLRNFTLEDVSDLYHQHTAETGQVFEEDAIDKVYEQTDGQPWLVNAIAREIIVKILNNDFTQAITVQMVEQAIKNIILRRDTHIDSLLDKLKDPRVRKIVEPIITGKSYEIRFSDDDTQYCLDLGLIKSVNNELLPANKIYNEVIIRTLTCDTQYDLGQKIQNIWINDAGIIDMTGLLKGFQAFWRENSDIWVKKYEYQEAAPHLILQAFLQRIINGGGTILREYAAGRERMDLCVIYENKKYPIELKLLYSKSVVEEGLKQLSNYMTTLDENTGWLIIFDRSAKKSWDKKLYWKTDDIDGKTIHIVGC